MKVLVTGGTGYLGAAIVRALAARAHHPRVFARSATRSAVPGERFDGDVRDAAALRRAADACDAVCHVAALVSLWRPRRQDFHDVNVGGLRNVLRVAADLDLRRIVYTSSFLALPPDGCTTALRANDYQCTKTDALDVAREAAAAGAPLVIAVPGVVYGPGALTEGNLVGRLLADHVAGRLHGLIGPERVWPYAYVEDVALGHVLALERGVIGQTYCLGGENVPQMHLFDLVRELTGRPLPRRIPFALATLLAVAEEARSSIFRVSPRLTRGVVRIFRHDWRLDSTQAVRELGYSITSVREGVPRTLRGLERQPPAESA